MHRKFSIYLIFIFSIFNKSLGLTYHQNDSIHEQLPVLYELDHYDSCMQDPAAIYCVASLELYGEPDNKIYNMIQKHTQHRINHYNYSVIDRGVCVTKTCSKYVQNLTLNDEDIKKVLRECINDKIKEKHDISTRLLKLNCDRHVEDEKIDSLDYFVATVIISICTIVLIGSWYDLRHGTNREDDKIGKGEQFLQCFSVSRNIKELTLNSEQLSDLKGFHGIRAFASLNVVYTHSIFLLSLFISDVHTFEKMYENLWFRVLFSVSNLVQIFFIISGFLLTYLQEINAEKGEFTWKYVIRVIIKRWWRLATSMAFVIAIGATWFRFIGSGPLWKYYVSSFAKPQSRQYFWHHLFFLNNFFKDDTCYYQTWHVAADIQLYIPCLIVHFMIRNRSLRYKIGILSFLLVIGIVSPIIHVWLQDLNCNFLITPEMYRTIKDDTFNKYYVLPHNNLAGFVIGMATGYFAYDLKQKKMELPNFKLGSFLCWLAMPMYLGIAYVASLSFVHPGKPSLTFRILYAASHRVVSGLIGGVWILGSIMKFNGCSKALLEWRWWVVPSKLSYGVYLVHSVVINYLLGLKNQILYYSFPNFFFVYIGIVVVSNVLALVLYLLVEGPSTQLIKIFMEHKPSSENKKEI